MSRWPKWTQNQLNVLEILRRYGKQTPKQIAQRMDKPSDDSNIVSAPLKKLVKHNLAEKEGRGKNTNYTPK